MINIVTGDDTSLLVTLKKGGNTFSIDSGATIKASLTSVNKSTILITPVEVLEATSGSDWANSKVVVVFSAANTGAISEYKQAILEIQVDDSGKKTWFGRVNVVKGTIA